MRKKSLQQRRHSTSYGRPSDAVPAAERQLFQPGYATIMKATPTPRLPQSTLVPSSPHGAWLLMGDEGSFYSRGNLRRLVDRDRAGLFLDCWTCSPRVEIGDVLFMYYMAPRKAIHFVCRATSRPYVDPALYVRADREVSKYQWWVDISPPVEVEPIPFNEIRQAMGGYLNLKGRAGKYVDVAVGNRLLKAAKVMDGPSAHYAGQTLTRLTGRRDLPDPEKMSLSEWRKLASGKLKGEREVELYIVQPLLRYCGIPRKSAIHQLRTGEGIPDYVITRDTVHLAAVEVKQRIAGPRGGVKRWTDLPDYEQLCRYTRHLGCKGMLVDCDQVFLFSGQRMKLLRRFDRQFITLKDAKVIGRFLMSPQLGARAVVKKSSVEGKRRARAAVTPLPFRDENTAKTRKPSKRSRTAAIRRKLTVSSDLAKIVGFGPHTPTSLTKKVWKYIYDHDLLVDANPMSVLPDAALATVLGTKRAVELYELSDLFSRHIK